jgi:uncharacterized protein (TIGR02118 family)
MLKLAILVKRNDALTPEQFRHHLAVRHAGLVKACPASSRYIRGYVQSFVRAEEHTAHDGTATSYDALVELWFDNQTEMERFYADPEYVANVQPDEPNFADIAGCAFMITEENRVL